MKPFEFKLFQVTLYAKGWYKRTDIWQDLKICLGWDGYTPFTKEDVITIITRNCCRLFQDRAIQDYTLDLLIGISPAECWKYGYCTKDTRWVDDVDNLPEYDYFTATLYFFLSKLQGASKEDLGWDEWPEALEDIMPLRDKEDIHT